MDLFKIPILFQHVHTNIWSVNDKAHNVSFASQVTY